MGIVKRALDQEKMVFLTRLLAALPKARIKWYTYDQICRGKDAINDILPLTIMNVKLVYGLDTVLATLNS